MIWAWRLRIRWPASPAGAPAGRMHGQRHRRAAGNAALEEIVMAINVRNDKFRGGQGSTPRSSRAPRSWCRRRSFPVQYNKAIVGRNAFAHESGIHQDGVLKGRIHYESCGLKWSV